jgi:long-subunit fatty acid transport protein
MHQSQNATVAFQKKLWPYPTIILVLLVTSTVILPTQTAAQEIKRLEMSGGYTFLDSSEIVDSFGIGWLAGGAWNTTEWLALGIELNSSAQQQSE